MRGGSSSAMGNPHVKRGKNTVWRWKICTCWSMSQILPTGNWFWLRKLFTKRTRYKKRKTQNLKNNFWNSRLYRKCVFLIPWSRIPNTYRWKTTSPVCPEKKSIKKEDFYLAWKKLNGKNKRQKQLLGESNKKYRDISYIIENSNSIENMEAEF